MKTVLACLGLLLGAGFMLTQIATTPLPNFQANYKHASAAVLVISAAGVGWLFGWLVGWALARFTKDRTAEHKNELKK
jgi:NhaP-type Na+/H+ or K+/H+ antiporter